MERICPARRARVQFSIPVVETVADLPKAMSAVLAAIADGALSPDEGGAIGSALSQQQRILETVELEQRIAALEQKGASQ